MTLELWLDQPAHCTLWDAYLSNASLWTEHGQTVSDMARSLTYPNTGTHPSVGSQQPHAHILTSPGSPLLGLSASHLVSCSEALVVLRKSKELESGSSRRSGKSWAAQSHALACTFHRSLGFVQPSF